MTEELKEMADVLVVMMEEVVEVVVVVVVVTVKLGVIVTEPWVVLNPLFVAVDGKEPPPPAAALPPPAPPE
jgi:hypothetical protein